MKYLSDLDFALDRSRRKKRRQAVIAALGLALGLQLGAAAWRWQSLQSSRAALVSQLRQLGGNSARSGEAALSAAQIKVAISAQAMLDTLTVPWEALLQAIESARTPGILVESIQPHAAQGSVSLSVSAPDYATLAGFIDQLIRQDALHEVMLASESRSDTAGALLHAVITAKWGKTP